MTTAKCFRCGKGYPTIDRDDLAGDGKCPECKEISKKIALDVDLKMGQQHRIATKNFKRSWDEKEALMKEKGFFRAKDLGIL